MNAAGLATTPLSVPDDKGPVATALFDRPRERMWLDGCASLSDSELLAVLLGTGVRGEPVLSLANRVLHFLGGLQGLCKVSPRELADQHGIGCAKAARALAGLELGRRASVRSCKMKLATVHSASDVAEWATAALVPLDHEEVWLLSLDAKNHLLARHRIAMGGLHGCALTPKDVLRPAIRDCASAIVLVHNHPSGDPTPSPSDLQMTHVVAAAAQVVGLQLLDHIVVSGNGYASLHELGAVDQNLQQP